MNNQMRVNHREHRGHSGKAKRVRSLCPLCPLWLTLFFAAFALADVTVPGDFPTVQAAVDAIKDGTKDRTVIVIKPGTYKERIEIGKNKGPVTFRGDGKDPKDVVLTYDMWAQFKGPDGKEVGTSGSASTLILSDDFTAENLTFENPSGEKGQAVAVRFTSDRLIFRNCRFLGGQDTLYTNGKRSYFDNCYVEGRVDFIFGRATAVFDHCTIHSKNGGYVTAPSTKAETKYGLVFLNCKLTGDGQPAQLGRPWRPDGMAAFIRCEMGAHIDPVGLNNWGKESNEKTARFIEFGNTGPGAKRDARVKWARELTADEAAEFKVKNILSGDDGWQPTEGQR